MAPRGRRHLAVPGRAHRRCCSPSRILATDPEHDAKAVLRLAAGARGRLHRASSSRSTSSCSSCSSRSCSCPMYFLIGEWGHGNRVYAATKFFLYTMFGSALMLVGILVARLPQRPTTPASITFDLVELGRATQASGHQHRRLGLPVLRPGLRGQGAAVPAAHLAARRPHRGAHRRLGHPGRRHAEAGHLRLPPLRRSTCSPRPPYYFAPPLVTLGVIGIIYGADRRHDAAGPEAARRLLVGRPPRLHRARHLRPHHPGHRGRHAPDGQPRHLHRRAVPPGRAGSTSGATPARSPSSAVCRSRRRSSPPSSRWSCCRRSACPASTASSASS